MIFATNNLNSLYSMLRARTVLSACAMLVVFLMSMVSGAAVAAQPSLPAIDNRADIPLPDDYSQLSFYLVTIDVGDHVWDNFGHTAVRVVDESSGTDLMFNWGLFDTSVGLLRFGWNFMSGVMDYRLGVAPAEWELARYSREQRTVWQDRITLTAAQKERLYQRLSWNLREENIVYGYDYFADNCTTRVRDYINEALQGEIYDNSRVNVPRTFRDEVVTHYESLPPIALSLDVLMNSRIDQRMTQWQQMFLPLSLREQLRRMDVLVDEQVIVEFAPPPSRFNPYHASGLLLLPVMLLFLLVRRVPIASFGSTPGFVLSAPDLSYRLLGLIALTIALCSGIWGLIMVFGWWLSAHQDLHQNLNLLLFWPTDILAVFFALRWLLTGRALRITPGRHSLVSFYLVMHILAALVYLLIGLFGLSEQRTTDLMLFVVPLLLLFAVLVMTAGFRPVRNVIFS